MQPVTRACWRSFTAVVAALTFAGCADNAAGPSAPLGEFVLTADVVGTTVSTLVVQVTAPDITTPLAFNLQAANGVASGTIRIPPGDNRTITVDAFDNLGNLTHEGSKTVNVKPGQNPPVSIPVVSRAGQVPIDVVMGAVRIVISPASAEMQLSGNLTLTTTITGPNGDILPGPANFATLNPTVATVDANGRVTAVGAGTVQIVATYAGVGAASTISIASRLAVVGGATLTVFDGATLANVGSFTLSAEGFSVTGAGNGRLYIGESSNVVAITPDAGAATETVGSGLFSGNIYGLSARNGILYASGSGMPQVRASTLAGAAAPGIAAPAGIGLRASAFGLDGTFYLTSFFGAPVERFTAGFVSAGTFGTGVGLTGAFGVAVMSNGNVVVSGQNDAAYFIFSATGSFIRRVPVNCGGQLRGVAADFAGNVWIACFGENAVVKFDPQDQEVTRLHVSTPSGIAIF